MNLNMSNFRDELKTEKVRNNFRYMIDYRCNSKKGW